MQSFTSEVFDIKLYIKVFDENWKHHSIPNLFNKVNSQNFVHFHQKMIPHANLKVFGFLNGGKICFRAALKIHYKN